MTKRDERAIRRLERELEGTKDPKRRAFIKATINRTLHKGGMPPRYESYE